jgi:hypothetical protein
MAYRMPKEDAAKVPTRPVTTPQKKFDQLAFGAPVVIVFLNSRREHIIVTNAAARKTWIRKCMPTGAMRSQLSEATISHKRTSGSLKAAGPGCECNRLFATVDLIQSPGR